MKRAVEDAVKRIQTDSAKLSVNRHIAISVIAFGGSAPPELKLLSDVGHGLYIPTNVGNDSDLIEAIATSLACIIGSSRSIVANDITVNIQANSHVNNLTIFVEYYELNQFPPTEGRRLECGHFVSAQFFCGPT